MRWSHRKTVEPNAFLWEFLQGSMPTLNETYASVLTPAGRGAIAVVRITGPAALEAVDQSFQAANAKQLRDQPIDRINFGRWRAAQDSSEGEELVVCRTGETEVEVHCHGGDAAVRAVVQSLLAAGCRESPWQDQPQPGVDLVQQEARTALAACTTERTAALLVEDASSNQGPLHKSLESLESALAENRQSRASKLLAELQRYADMGRHLTTPWRVALVGPPNVGKSSLINRLVGYERAIVFDQPGTTRDVVTARAALDGWPIQLTDTAGLRESDDPIEKAGVKLARQVLAESDLVILVTSANEAPLADERGLIGELKPEQRLLRVCNKWDLREPQLSKTAFPAGTLVTSATLGNGIDQLVAAIAEALVPDPPPPGAAVPFASRHFELLEQIEG